MMAVKQDKYFHLGSNIYCFSCTEQIDLLNFGIVSFIFISCDVHSLYCHYIEYKCNQIWRRNFTFDCMKVSFKNIEKKIILALKIEKIGDQLPE